MKEVIVLIGNYGSGKTELALNFAFQAARAGKKVELIDLDMVNTYFRLTDRGNLIKSREIRLVSPNLYTRASRRSPSRRRLPPPLRLTGTPSSLTSAVTMPGRLPSGATTRTLLHCPRAASRS